METRSLTDSIEVCPYNWTDDMLAQFRRFSY